jgi:hemin uptake protein HemP
MANRLPDGAQRFGPLEIDRMYAHLAKNHKISPHLARQRLHAIKSHYGYRGDDNIIFDHTGNAYDPVSLEWLGSLTEGGAK